MIQLNKRRGYIIDYLLLLLGILSISLLLIGIYKDYTNTRSNPYYKLDKQSIDFNGIRYKINRNFELEIYNDIITRTQHYNPVLRIFTTSTYHTYKLIKKISFDISEVN